MDRQELSCGKGKNRGLHFSDACHHCPWNLENKGANVFNFYITARRQTQEQPAALPRCWVTSSSTDFECLTIIFCGYRKPNEPGKDVICGIFH